MSRGARLRAFVETSGRAPMLWGASDCCAWPAQWAAQETGRPVPLPRYASLGEARALIAEAGGLDVLAERILAPLGLASTGQPQVGDIGVIRLSRFDVGVIFAAGGIALWRAWDGNAAGGVGAIVPRTILRAWAL